jgi:hypothetical protein
MMGGGGSLRFGRWNFQNIHGTSSIAWPGGLRVFLSGAWGWGSGLPPRKTLRLLAPVEFSTAGLDWKRKSRFPRKDTKS